jgi:hypothetical protein
VPDAFPINPVLPSATPNEAEIAAWTELPRDEQVRRLRQVLTSPEASTPSTASMAEIEADESAG